MKKAFVIFGIFAALVALFAISCSAAVISNSPVAYTGDFPINGNLYQPQYESTFTENNDVVYPLITVTPKIPNNANNSALGVVLPYYTPNNDTYQVAGDFRFSASVPLLEDIILPVTMFGGNNSSKTFTGSYLHFVFDFGGSILTAGRSTSTFIKEHIYIMFRGDRYFFTFSGNLGFADVALPAGAQANEFTLRLDARLANTLSDKFMLLNYAFVYQDFVQNSQPYFDYHNFTLGYTTAVVSNQSPEGGGTVESNKYYFDLGYAQGLATGEKQYSVGYEDGVRSVTDVNGDPVNIRTLIFAVPDAMVSLFRSLFNWEFAGFNLFLAFKFLLALLAVCFVVRLVMRSMV